MTMTIREYARALVANGYPVLPLRMMKKEPLLTSWQNRTPHTLEEFDKQAILYTDNIGILCDAVTVLDFDAHGDELPIKIYEGHRADFDGCVVERTPSGGIHVYCAPTGGEKTYARFILDEATVDIEVLRGRRYAVCSPSRLSNGIYEHINSRTHLDIHALELPPIPGVFKEAIERYEAAKPSKITDGDYKRSAEDDLTSEDRLVVADYYYRKYLEGATRQHRHHRGYALACTLFNLGMGGREVERYLRNYAGNISRRMTDEEIQGILKYAKNSNGEVHIPWKTVMEKRRQRLLREW